jgi:hypothetical protein
MMSQAAPAPAFQLAAEHLRGSRVSHGARIPAQRHRLAIAALGSGPDPIVGEVPVALLDDVIDDEKFSYGALFTDRRLLGRAGDDAIDLPYPAIEDARASTGVVIDDLHVTAWQRGFKLSGLPDVQPVASFLSAMLRIHPGYRVGPPIPLVATSPDDPTGGGAARMSIWSRDLRVLPLVGMGLEGHQRGWFSAEIAQDHISRAMIFDRTLASGRGTHEGWWVSPLGGPDLAYAFTRMLGAPTHVFQEGGARVLDFRVGARGSVAGAAASTAVGLVALGVLGVGWVSRPGQTFTDVRVKITPGQASSGFVMFSGASKLSQEAPGLVASIFEILPRIEGRMLLQRAAFGWDAPPEQLDETPTRHLFTRVAEAIGEIELSIYFPKAPSR